MKILAFSDLHLDQRAADLLLEAATDADLVLGVGDFAQRRVGLADYVAQFAQWGKKAIFVPGNNETDTELRAALRDTGIHILHGDTVTVAGVKIAGIGAAIPPLPPLAWVSFDLREEDAETLLDPIADADILLSHSPPKGVADVHQDLGSLGSVAVRDATLRLSPNWLLCGHIHDAWGEQGRLGTTEVLNLGPTPNWISLD